MSGRDGPTLRGGKKTKKTIGGVLGVVARTEDVCLDLCAALNLNSETIRILCEKEGNR